MALGTKPYGGSQLPEPTAVPPSVFSEEDQVRTPLSGREWVAVCLAGSILLSIVIISAFLLFAWRVPLPNLSGLSPESQAASIAQYKELTTILGDRTEKLFDLIVTKTLLPVFATLLGYLLGRRSSG